MFRAVRLLGLNLSGHPQACSPRICRAHVARAPSGTEHPPCISAPRPCAEGGRARLPVLAAPFDAAWWQQRSAARLGRKEGDAGGTNGRAGASGAGAVTDGTGASRPTPTTSRPRGGCHGDGFSKSRNQNNGETKSNVSIPSHERRKCGTPPHITKNTSKNPYVQALFGEYIYIYIYTHMGTSS